MQPEPIVYVIDDDDAVRHSLEFLLKTAGIEVRGFRFGQGISGNAAADQIRLHHYRRAHAGDHGHRSFTARQGERLDIPVIVITGHGDISLAVEAMKIGAVDFLEKPFDDDLLLASVRSALNKEAEHRQAQGRARRHPRQAGRAVEPRAPGPRRSGCGQSQQGHRLRPRHQPAHGRDLPRQPDDQDGSQQPVRPGAHGDDGRHPDQFQQGRALTGDRRACQSPGAMIE